MTDYLHICACGSADCVINIHLTKEDSNFVFNNNFVVVADGCQESLPPGFIFVKKLIDCTIYKDPKRELDISENRNNLQ